MKVLQQVINVEIDLHQQVTASQTSPPPAPPPPRSLLPQPSTRQMPINRHIFHAGGHIIIRTSALPLSRML